MYVNVDYVIQDSGSESILSAEDEVSATCEELRVEEEEVMNEVTSQETNNRGGFGGIVIGSVEVCQLLNLYVYTYGRYRCMHNKII